jgi:hypothetical protein
VAKPLANAALFSGGEEAEAHGAGLIGEPDAKNGFGEDAVLEALVGKNAAE